MKLSVAATSFLAGLAAAAPSYRALDAYEEKALEKRQLEALSIAIIAGAISGVVSASASFAIQKIASISSNVADWDDVSLSYRATTLPMLTTV